jgi:uncharacterized protein (TIGR03437 family)
MEPVAIAAASPEIFYFALNANGHNPIAAVNAVSGQFVAAPGAIPGLTTVFAQPNDYLTVYATGLGPTMPSIAAGAIPTAAAPITSSITVTIGGVTLDPSNVLYAGVSGDAGLYQINIQLPDSVPDGDDSFIVTVNGVQSPVGAYLTVKRLSNL